MILLTVEEIIVLHGKLIAKTGGLDGLRDRGLLESAVFSLSTSFADVERYATVEEKAARAAFAIVNNHAFVDGNKRIGILVMLMLLRLNDVPLSYAQKELIGLGLSLADGSADFDKTLVWIQEHELL